MKKLVLLLALPVWIYSCTGNHTGDTESSPGADGPVAALKTAAELGLLIPQEISGYKPAKLPGGLDITAKNARFAFATQYYYKDGDSITIELHDYLEAPMLYEHYETIWWLSGQQVDGPAKKAGLVNLGEGVDAWCVNYKEEGRTTIYAGVDNRYYLIFECFGRDNTGFIESVARQFDYHRLRGKN